jgi:hypothetical protein
MKRKYIRDLITGSLFMGLLAFNPGAQAIDPLSIGNSCIFFTKVVFHLKKDLTTSSGRILAAKETREIILLGKYSLPPTNVTQTFFSALCGSSANCIHNKENTVIDSVGFSADCDDTAIRSLTESTTP